MLTPSKRLIFFFSKFGELLQNITVDNATFTLAIMECDFIVRF
jgi:hypothetical protein